MVTTTGITMVVQFSLKNDFITLPPSKFILQTVIPHVIINLSKIYEHEHAAFAVILFYLFGVYLL